MLSYRHGFHCGNFADVMKHSILTLILDAMLRKDKPLCYIDTHAGAGVYDLTHEYSQMHREYVDGIGRLWGCEHVVEECRTYLGVVRTMNPQGAVPICYPGSPWIAKALLRPTDRIVLHELHPADFETLQAVFPREKRLRVHRNDGYQGLTAALPPLERRGLVFIDPPFELREERERLFEALKHAWSRWPAGTYAIWLPILDRASNDRFLRRLRVSGIGKVLVAELRPRAAYRPTGLNGSMMVVVNPPYRLDEGLMRLLAWLGQCLSPDGTGAWRVDWLVPELHA